MMKQIEQPDGIIITIGEKMYGEKGYRHWLRNFLDCMAREDCVYSLRQGTRPKQDFLYVYLLIGGKIRFRCNFVTAYGAGEMTFEDGRVLEGKAWVSITGPVVRADREIGMKGFQGFRYCEKIF